MEYLNNLKRDRGSRWVSHLARARKAAADPYHDTFEHFLETPNYGNYILEAYRSAGDDFYPEIFWKECSVKSLGFLCRIGITRDRKTSHDFLLLLWDEHEEPEPAAVGFVDSISVMRIAAFLPRASHVAGLKGDLEDLTLDVISRR